MLLKQARGLILWVPAEDQHFRSARAFTASADRIFKAGLLDVVSAEYLADRWVIVQADDGLAFKLA